MAAETFTAGAGARIPEVEARTYAGQSTAAERADVRHLASVRITHWLMVAGVAGLLVTGGGILISHPRLYWGETGAIGTPSLIDLPLPFMLTGQSGWGRSLHFLSAWVCVLSGLFYVLSGLLTQHFRRDFLPAKADLAWDSISRVTSSHLGWKRISKSESMSYNVLQQLTYLVVVFVLFPVMIWTGLAMSPAIVSVFPALVTMLGGQQSARTIHFVAADLLVLFLLVHVAMICRAGFSTSVRAMITGGSAATK